MLCSEAHFVAFLFWRSWYSRIGTYVGVKQSMLVKVDFSFSLLDGHGHCGVLCGFFVDLGKCEVKEGKRCCLVHGSASQFEPMPGFSRPPFRKRHLLNYTEIVILGEEGRIPRSR